MGRRGSKNKPSAILQLQGTYRADRHADRMDNAAPKGSPIKPDGLSADEASIWDSVIDLYAGKPILGEIDTAELLALCETWGLYRQAVALAKTDPVCKEIRCAVVAYLGVFDRLAAKFGLTAADRANLKLGAQSEATGVSAFARKRG